MKRLSPQEYLRRKWCPYCHTPLTLVQAVTPRESCRKYVCLICHASYSELKRKFKVAI